MDLTLLLDHVPEPLLAALFGLLVGAVFGLSAERSSFCLRAAAVEFARGSLGGKAAVWLLTFSTAMVWVQGALHGWLAPLRQELAGLWTTPGGRNPNLLTALSLPEGMGLVAGLGFTALALILARRNAIAGSTLVFASGVGFAVALGWVLTFSLSQQAFEPVSVTSATFSGPSANMLMFFLTEDPVLDFDVGLVPGVVLGASVSAALKRRLKFQGFDGEGQMRCSMLGAVLMGFGAMLTGGCAIGAGVSGGSIFVATAWLALLFMWIGAILTDLLVDQASDRVPA